MTTQDIRNVCLLGHGGDGKTSLAESMLFLTKGTDRLGKTADGNTVSDYDAEEIKRQISISATLLPVEFGKSKINVLDTPGYFDFAGEVMQSLRVSEAGVILCTAKSGIGVGTEKSWKYLLNRKLPRFFYVSKLDEENADFYAVYEALRNQFGTSVCPLVIPVVEGGKAVAVVDVARKTAYKIDGAKTIEMAVPDSIADKLEQCYETLKESVAETSEALMDKYFSGEDFTREELINGIKEGVRTLTLAPVFCGSAYTGLGTENLLTGLVDFAPSPLEAPTQKAVNSSGAEIEVKLDPKGSPCVFVFKTISDQYGKFSYFKVISGTVTPDMSFVNAQSGQNEKFGHIYITKGKKNAEIKELCCGDIGAVSKLVDTTTGDTLCTVGKVITLEGIGFAQPCYSMAISPKIKGQEDKIAAGLTRMNEEDLTFTVENNSETHQMVVSGAGDIQLDVLCSRLKSRFNVDVELSPARVPYREKIRKKVRVQGRHKKQSGGHGQFGDVWIEFEPGTSEEMIFEEKIFGGSVPKNFHPAVEKGLRDSVSKGVLAGYPVVYLKATLVDGSYHDVDSSEMAFKTAAGLAYRAGLPQASPVLLEPIGSLKVTVPNAYMGDIIGDVNKRRGRVLGMSPGESGEEVVEAEVPMAEMSSYAIDLRSMTQSRGSFLLKFNRYEEAPATVQQKVIEQTKHIAEDED